MSTTQDIRTGRHCVYNIHMHWVFVTQYRRGVFTPAMLEELQPIFASLCRALEADLAEMDAEDAHVHLRVTYPPKLAISTLVNALKGVSSRRLRNQHHPSIRDKLWGGPRCSPSSFAASCGGAPIEVVRQSIEQQREPH